MKMKLVYLLCLSVFISASAKSLPGDGQGGLELIDFTVTQNLNKIDIKWSTSAIKTGGPYFCIEKSKDGKNYTKIVDLPATGQETSYADYFETDYQPYLGVSYYRIKQVDAAGNFRYSQVVTLRIEEDKKLEIYDAISNSYEEETLKKIEVEDSEVLLVIRDKNGDDHYSKATIDYSGSNMETINLTSPVNSGTYQVVGASSEKLHSVNVFIK